MIRPRLVLAFTGLVLVATGTARAEAPAADDKADAKAGAAKAAPAASDAKAPEGQPSGVGKSTSSAGEPVADADATVAAGVPMVDAATQDAGGARYGLGVRARWVSVPSFLLGIFLNQSKSLSSYTVGVEGFRRHGDFDFVLGVAWQSLSPPDGNWLGKGKDPATDTDFVQFRGLGAISVDAAFILRTELNPYVTLHYGGGLGIGITTGKMLRTSDGTPGCASSPGDVTKCYPILVPPCAQGPCSESQLAASEGSPDTPQRGSRYRDDNVPAVYPIVNVVTGLDFRIPNADGLEIKTEVGFFFPYFFLGGGVTYRI
ncbi:MAG TPA: hypothetical protein VGP07_04780 [Polyangia bacterium]